MTAQAEAAARIWQSGLDRAARGTARQLLALWDSLGGYDWTDGDLWRLAARPIVIGSSQAAIDATATYVDAALPRYASGSASPLIVSDSAARLYDPFDLIAHLVGNGAPWELAVASGRSSVERLGRDTVWRSARQAIAEQVVGVPGWVRRLDGDACDWCVSLSSVVWDTAAQATFGHDNCGCVPVPSDAIGAHNRRITEARGIDSPASYNLQQQQRRLRRSEAVARRRQAQAATEAATEPDARRRERLSTREQEWETRAERAAERLRLLAA